jgi:hypothetical protein
LIINASPENRKELSNFPFLFLFLVDSPFQRNDFILFKLTSNENFCFSPQISPILFEMGELLVSEEKEKQAQTLLNRKSHNEELFFIQVSEEDAFSSLGVQM